MRAAESNGALFAAIFQTSAESEKIMVPEKDLVPEKDRLVPEKSTMVPEKDHHSAPTYLSLTSSFSFVMHPDYETCRNCGRASLRREAMSRPGRWRPHSCEKKNPTISDAAGLQQELE